MKGNLKLYLIIAILALFFANYGIKLVINKLIFSQTCFTQQQVSSDSKCLYILNNKVYEKQTRSNPHKGHPCGMDVTSIIPSFHLSDVAQYLDPNFRGSICVQPTVTPFRSPTPPTPSVFLTPSLIPTVTGDVSKSGDGNRDGIVNGVDYVIWLNNYEKTLSGAMNGDYNNSGFVDGVDYVVWLANFGR